MANDKSYNEIPSLQEDWGLDNRNNLPYSGRSVQEFIKKYLTLTNLHDTDKAACIGFKNMVAYLFASQEDKNEWENNGLETWIDSTPLVIVGTENKIQITNKSGNNNPYFTTSQKEAIITVTFKSLEKDVIATEYTEIMEDALFTVSIDKGTTGAWSTIVSDVLVKYGNEFSIDIQKYLAIGANRVIIKAVGSSTGATGQLNITANLTSMYLTPANFAWNTPFIEGQGFKLGGMNIGGNLNKTLHIKISNEKGYTRTYDEDLGSNQYINTAYYYGGLEFPTQGTGVYNVELWLDANGVESDHLIYNIICVAQNDISTAQLIAISSVPETIVNYADNTLFQYVVYDKGNSTTSPNIIVKSLINQKPTVIVGQVMEDGSVVGEVLANVPTATINTYEMGVEIESEETNIQLTADIAIGNSMQSAVYNVDNSLSYPPTSGFNFYLNPTARNNAQSNREDIINAATGESISAEWTKMSWADNADGYTTDGNGRKCLYFPAMSKCVMDYTPLQTFGEGKTIEFTFKVRNVADYDEPIITISEDYSPNEGVSTFRGVRITPDNILLHSRDKWSSDLTQGLNLQDEVMLNVIITFIRNYKVTYGNLCQIYINGEKARSFEFDTSDSWNTNAKLTLGSQTADLYIYNIRVYDNGFDKENAEKNYVASLNNAAEKKLMHEFINSVRDDKGAINYDAVKGVYNTMTVRMLNGASLPHKGLSKEYSAWCDVEFDFKTLPTYYKTKVWNFLLKNCKIEGQGTTSMNYWLWNLRFRIDKSDNIEIIYPNGQKVILNQ